VDTVTEKENLAHLMLEAIDVDIVTALCTGCEAREFYPATDIDPEEETCPADFSPSDTGCVKHDRYKALHAMALEIIDTLATA